MTPNEELTINIDKRPEMTVISPMGEIDLSRAPAFRTNIAEVFAEKPAKVVVDLRGVPYMDSSGVATLVEGMQLSNKAGTIFILVALQERVKSIFEIARLDTVFKIVDELAQAEEV